MGIVAGLDSSPDFTRIVVCDTDTGSRAQAGVCPASAGAAPSGGRPSDVDPQAWLLSLGEAAGGGLLEGVQAIGVSAQQNALVALDAQGNTVRPALVGGDKRAQVAAADLVDALGGREAWAQAVGCVPQAAQPVTKLRWMARTEPDAALRIGRAHAAARLAGVAAAGPAGPPDHRPGRRLRDRVLVGGYRCRTGPIWSSWRSGIRRCCPRCSGRRRPRGRPRGAADLRGDGRDDGRGVRAGHRARRRGGVAGRLRVRDGRAPRGARRLRRDDHLARRRDRACICRWCTTLNAVRALRGTAELLGCPTWRGCPSWR